MKTYSQGCLWSLRGLWIRELEAKALQTSYHWLETNWVTPDIFRAASTYYSENVPPWKVVVSFSFFCSFPASWHLTFDSCVGTILPPATEVIHTSMRWHDETPFRSHLSNWECCHSPSKPWYHRVWGKRCFWSGRKVIPSQTRLSEIIVWEENGFVPILIDIQTQGAATDVQKIERKKNCTFDDCYSFSLLPYYFILLENWKDFLQLTSCKVVKIYSIAIFTGV